MPHVTIIGAGVIGLQTAISLREAHPEWDVSVVAEYWPGDERVGYTSMWAGAIWRSHASASDEEQCAWDLKSYERWMGVLEGEPLRARSMGLLKCPLTIYEVGAPSPSSTTKEQPWYAPHVKNFTHSTSTSTDSNCQSKSVHAHTFTSIALNPVTYLTYLHTRARSLGITFIKKRLSTPLQLALETDTDILLPTPDPKHKETVTNVVVNCSGLSAHTFTPDKDVYPISGQTLLAHVSFSSKLDGASKQPEILLSQDDSTGEVAYIVPRFLPKGQGRGQGQETGDGNGDEGLVYILGGTKTPLEAQGVDGLSAHPREDVSRGIVERCRTLLERRYGSISIRIQAEEGLGFEPESTFPDAEPTSAEQDPDISIQLLKAQLGYRPARKGGARVEVEEFYRADGRVSVVHCYGHSGAGFQGAVGSAERVVGIVEGLVKESKDGK